MKGGVKKTKKISLKVRVKKPVKKIIKKSINKEKKTELEIEERLENDRLEALQQETRVSAMAEMPYDMPVISREELLEMKAERSKKMIMWSGVIFFMVIITVFWIYNTKKIIQSTKLTDSQNQSDLNFQKMGDDISAQMDEMKKNLEEIKKFNIASQGNASTTALVGSSTELADKQIFSTTTGQLATTSEENIVELKNKLEILEKDN